MLTDLWNKLTKRQMEAFLSGARNGAMLTAILLFMWGAMQYNAVLALLPMGFLFIFLGAISEE